MTAIRYNGNSHTIKYNTIHKTGASSTLNPGNNPIIEDNNLYNSGYLQSDCYDTFNGKSTSEFKDTSIGFMTLSNGIRFDGMETVMMGTYIIILVGIAMVVLWQKEEY